MVVTEFSGGGVARIPEAEMGRLKIELSLAEAAGVGPRRKT
jgi:hypothetical protein